ncbi:MAG: heme o synthase [Pyrinomonadaceae bacterium]|jgi:protoheme IX farnesyltransferase|nr:heme o synthase [Pyrinomonadaceae bacterium]
MENIIIQETKSISIREKSLAYLELTKPRIALMLVLTSAAGFYLGIKQTFDLWLFINSMLGITLLAFGVATLNQYIERNLDVLMDRTQNRPLPSAKVSPNEALIFGILLCLAAEIMLYVLVNPLTAILGITVIVGYVLLYTPLKTKTSASTAIGAIPGAMPPLMGWTAAANEISLGALVTFIMLFLWQFPHFLAIAWLYREQYAKAGILMLPVVEPEGKMTARQIVIFAAMLLPIGLAPFFVGIASLYYLIGASLLGIWFLFESVKMAKLKTHKSAKRLLLVSVAYLPLIYGLMVITH